MKGDKTMIKKKKLPLEVLLKHLKEYKDAVIILGPDIAESNVSVTDDSVDKFNRKTMVRDPQTFWNYYAENLMKIYSYNDITTETVEALLCFSSNPTKKILISSYLTLSKFKHSLSRKSKT